MKPVAVVIMALVALSLGGCGRKANPQPPPGSVYPVHYPTNRPDGDNWQSYRDDIEPGAVQPGTSKGDGQ